jgi:hypothetical protein
MTSDGVTKFRGALFRQLPPSRLSPSRHLTWLGLLALIGEGNLYNWRDFEFWGSDRVFDGQMNSAVVVGDFSDR